MKRTKRVIAGFILSLVLLFGPQIWLRVKYQDLIHAEVELMPHREFAIIFGAWVNENHSLSDVTRERMEAGIELYKLQKVEKLFISGDNRSNGQAEEMADYAVNHGVNPNDIVIDKLGIDTNDTCKHFAEIRMEGILVTQGYHLPRTMLMCETSKISTVALSADKLGILKSRGDNIFQIYATRTWRVFREAVLTWSFILGVYDRLSTEAEALTEQSE